MSIGENHKRKYNPNRLRQFKILDRHRYKRTYTRNTFTVIGHRPECIQTVAPDAVLPGTGACKPRATVCQLWLTAVALANRSPG